MSKKFKYNNGFEGVVSDDVAKILETKKQGKIVCDEKHDEQNASAGKDEKKGLFNR